LTALHPADLSAPAPATATTAAAGGSDGSCSAAAAAVEPVSFEQAIELIAASVSSVDPAVGDFVRMVSTPLICYTT
jgi:hypothetical protein